MDNTKKIIDIAIDILENSDNLESIRFKGKKTNIVVSKPEKDKMPVEVRITEQIPAIK